MSDASCNDHVSELALLLDGIVGVLLENADHLDVSVTKLYTIKERANAVYREANGLPADATAA